jgi:hypothetical protein
MFDWLFPSRYTNLGERPLNYGSPKCNHLRSLYSAWDNVSTTGTYQTLDKVGERDLLEVTYLERCNKCGEHRLVTHNIKAGTVTIKKQVVEDPDVA